MPLGWLQQQAKFKDLLSSSLNVLSFFVKQPVALIPQIEINHLAVQKPDTRIALIHLSSIFWFLCDFIFFSFELYMCVCVGIHVHTNAGLAGYCCSEQDH